MLEKTLIFLSIYSQQCETKYNILGCFVEIRLSQVESIDQSTINQSLLGTVIPGFMASVIERKKIIKQSY